MSPQSHALARVALTLIKVKSHQNFGADMKRREDDAAAGTALILIKVPPPGIS
jgi:hypothetical protein